MIDPKQIALLKKLKDLPSSIFQFHSAVGHPYSLSTLHIQKSKDPGIEIRVFNEIMRAVLFEAGTKDPREYAASEMRPTGGGGMYDKSFKALIKENRLNLTPYNGIFDSKGKDSKHNSLADVITNWKKEGLPLLHTGGLVKEIDASFFEDLAHSILENKMVEQKELAPQKESVEKKKESVTVHWNTLPYRSEMGFGNERLGLIPKGTTLEIKDKKGLWLQVALQNEQTVWIWGGSYKGKKKKEKYGNSVIFKEITKPRELGIWEVLEFKPKEQTALRTAVWNYLKAEQIGKPYGNRASKEELNCVKTGELLIAEFGIPLPEEEIYHKNTDIYAAVENRERSREIIIWEGNWRKKLAEFEKKLAEVGGLALVEIGGQKIRQVIKTETIQPDGTIKINRKAYISKTGFGHGGTYIDKSFVNAAGHQEDQWIEKPDGTTIVRKNVNFGKVEKGTLATKLAALFEPDQKEHTLTNGNKRITCTKIPLRGVKIYFMPITVAQISPAKRKEILAKMNQSTYTASAK